MRQTQFIGLTQDAKDFLKTCERLDEIENFTFGMFDEPIALKAWVDLSGNIYTETVQVSPWSSGPMIFTHLEDEAETPLFSWMLDESIRGHEYDRKEGIYWI